MKTRSLFFAALLTAMAIMPASDATAQSANNNHRQDRPRLQRRERPAPRFDSGLAVVPGTTFDIKGRDFHQDDKIVFAYADKSWQPFVLETTMKGDTAVSVVIPQSMKSGNFILTRMRGRSFRQLGRARINIVKTMPASAQVIAHRGFWATQGSTQNSRASLRKALELNIYGSETDVWLTPDGHLMANHDREFKGHVIMNTPADSCRMLTLANGEKMPELTEFLDMLKASESPTKLIIEIKDHGDAARNRAAATATVKAVKKAGVQDKVEYISFSDDACNQIATDDPHAKVAALTGGIAPAERKKIGCTGIDYHINEFRKHPEWVKAARQLGMTVNVWTVNKPDEMAEMTNLGVQFITTDRPIDAVRVKNYYDSHR